MIPKTKPAAYFGGCNEALLDAVPASAKSILEVGCGEGLLGGRLLANDRQRAVFGIERDAEVAKRAGQRLTKVFTLDVESCEVPLPDGTMDCILYGDVLEHLIDPEGVIRRHRRLLKPGGIILCSVPNVQHHSVIAGILRGDFQYQQMGILDATHLRFFTYATFIKLLLDTGYSPALVQAELPPCPADFLDAAAPLLRRFGLHPGRTGRYLGTYQYLFRGTPYTGFDEAANEPEDPLSFVVCVNDQQTLTDCLLSSPCLAPGSPHEVVPIWGCASAAEGLNRGLVQAKNPIVVFVHQDVYLPEGWPRRFLQQYRQAERLGPLGVVGVFGVTSTGWAGRVVDREQMLVHGERLPAAVETLDEVLLALPKDTPLRFDPALGFHFYGSDICVAAQQRGLLNVAVDAPCFHHSRTVDGALPLAFNLSAALFAQKWRERLPIATTCAIVAADGLYQ